MTSELLRELQRADAAARAILADAASYTAGAVPEDDDAPAPASSGEGLHMPLCRHGHPLTPDNVICERNGDTKCRECHRAADRRYQAAKVRGIPNGPLGGRSAEERFWEKVNKATGKFYAGTECWEWQGWVTNGYGGFSLEGRSVYAHRFAYELVHGPLVEGLEPDHLCRNPSCVRAEHLEAVDHRTNVLRGEAPAAINARKTHCKHGHEFTPENTHRSTSGNRSCRTCRRALERRRYARRCALKSTLGHGRAAGTKLGIEDGDEPPEVGAPPGTHRIPIQGTAVGAAARRRGAADHAQPAGRRDLGRGQAPGDAETAPG